MAVLHIRLMGDPVLRTPSAQVETFGESTRKLVKDLFDTMDAVNGAGLAAPQIGVNLQVFTYRIGQDRGYVINPSIENSPELASEGAEGCLSIPGLGFAAPRHLTSTVRGVDLDQRPVVIEASGMLARCMQHETDHLKGMLFIDTLTGEDRKAALRAIRTERYSGAAARIEAQRHGGSGSAFGTPSSAALTFAAQASSHQSHSPRAQR